MKLLLAVIVCFSCSAALAFGGRSDGSKSVWVKRSDGGISCSPEKAQSLDQASGELTKAGVSVLESRKVHDGKMRAQMCGIPTGAGNAFRIEQKDVSKAVSLGFELAPAVK